jgi:hypothetical protein
MVWAKAGPHQSATTDANSQVFFTVFLLRFHEILARRDIALPAHEGHDGKDFIEF